jgi:alanyl-tRNA synthetase
MKTNEIRQKYLEFFHSKGHTIVASDVLVPKWDPTVLFTPAGMNQFKDHFLGKVKLEYTRATTSQKCLRTGDIENVGRTAYHHTFFEMLGNFSFGDYFKREAIHWAWEFLTDKKWLGIDSNRLTVSVYLDDDEASEIWNKEIGLPLNRIARMGEHDNFWPAGAPTDGPDGVCGPCSEIFFHPDNGPECEIWNLVFTQFNRVGSPPNNLMPLPSKNIDTGMGLERIAATMQGVTTNFHIDILRPIVEAAAQVVGIRYEPDSENGRRLRRIADHVRACSMAIHENVYPGANKEEYVIRRLLRRAVLQGHEMGMREPFLFQLVPEVVAQMEQPYPELRSTADRVAKVIRNEERSFLSTLDGGLARMESIFDSMRAINQKTVNGKEAFDLYQTYGIPAELFAGLAGDRGLSFDWAGYQEALTQHGIHSGAGSKGVMGDFGPIDDIKREVKATPFLGYEETTSSGRVCGLVQDFQETAEDADKSGKLLNVQKRVSSLRVTNDAAAQYVVLDQTPFYAESGGQVGDTGILTGPNGKFSVTDTRKNGDVFIHLGQMIEGVLSDGDSVSANVDEPRRNAIRRAHSATHVLHYALQKNLGQHAQQRGSKVVDDWLRFDFANLEAVSSSQLVAIEKMVIDKVELGGPVIAEILPLEQAKKAGAMMLFGEKYPDPVRMVSIGDFSKELCGGIHVSQVKEIGPFEILSEENISAGTRRIQAVTGQRAIEFQQKVRDSIVRIAKLLKVRAIDVPSAVNDRCELAKSLKKQLTSSVSKGEIGASDSGRQAMKDDELFVDKAGKILSYAEIRDLLKSVAQKLNVSLNDAGDRVAMIEQEIESARNRLMEQVRDAIDPDELIAKAENVGGIRLIAMEMPPMEATQLKSAIDQIRKKIAPVAVFLATPQGDDKVILVAGLSRDLVNRGMSAGDWVKQVAPVVGGSGGGKPDMAQAGGKNPEKISQAVAAARDFILKPLVK